MSNQNGADVNGLDNLITTFIGSGVMAEAMISGLLRNNILRPNQIVAADPLPERCESLQARFGIQTTTHNREAIRAADILILSIKPQVLDRVFADLGELGSLPKLVISIIAGASIAQISDGLGNPNVVRSMPNTPARIGQGITVWAAAESVPDLQRQQAQAILASFGQEVFVEDEHYLDMATALSGTGPAYVFMFMEAMIDAGVHLGFSRRIAEQLVIQTMRGSVEYAAQSHEHPAALRNQVTSPGGTSAEAIYHLEKGGLRTVLSRAVWAAYQRSVALGVGKKVAHEPRVARNPDALEGDR
ncbi:MAG: pyrroline-5-carboxylate reductase [Chloroflexi bacterium CFX4]|nr:pyrroline-5-carboxylate reductase [Chloroflexi bacterium CFX4]MDL1922289.1 pyrroline-5-carboxylate reductase [Chloroflexi bacterium CFX3]